MHHIGIEDARKRLGDLVTAVQQGTDIVLTRNGKPAARIIRYRENTVATLTTIAQDLAAQIDAEAAVVARQPKCQVEKDELRRITVRSELVADAMRRVAHELRTADPAVRITEETARALRAEDLPVYTDDTDRSWFDRWRVYASPFGPRLQYAAWHWVAGYWQEREQRNAAEHLTAAAAALAMTDDDWAANPLR